MTMSNAATDLDAEHRPRRRPRAPLARRERRPPRRSRRRAPRRRAEGPERPRLHRRLRRRRHAPGGPGRRRPQPRAGREAHAEVPALVPARRRSASAASSRPRSRGSSSRSRAACCARMVGHLVLDATPAKLGPAIAKLRESGNRLNLNLLGEAVLGEDEADRRLRGTYELLARDDVDYVSIKVSSVVSQLSMWSFDEAVAKVVAQAHPALRARREERGRRADRSSSTSTWRSTATSTSPSRCSRRLLDQPQLRGLEAGIVLQAYLPDALGAMQELTAWATARRAGRRRADQGARRQGRQPRHGARRRRDPRLAARHLRHQAGHRHQLQARAGLVADARAHRCRAARRRRPQPLRRRLRLAHRPRARRRDARRVRDAARHGHRPGRGRAPRRRQPAALHARREPERVRRRDRLPDPPARGEREPGELHVRRVRARATTAACSSASRTATCARSPRSRPTTAATPAPNRTQNRRTEWTDEALAAAMAVPDAPAPGTEHEDDARSRASCSGSPADRAGRPPRPDGCRGIRCPDGARRPRRHPRLPQQPDTDPALAANREWGRRILARVPESRLGIDTIAAARIDDAATLERVDPDRRRARPRLGRLPGAERAAVLHRAGLALAANRDRLIEVMAAETGKTIAEADPEISEAIDFAHYYAERARELDHVQGAVFVPSKLTVVTPPWNFPVAIPAGGVLAALAAGSGVIIKPAKLAQRSGAVMVEALWEAGVPRELLALVDLGERELGTPARLAPRRRPRHPHGRLRDRAAVPLVPPRPAAARRDERQERDHRDAVGRPRPRGIRRREERLRPRRPEVLGRVPRDPRRVGREVRAVPPPARRRRHVAAGRLARAPAEPDGPDHRARERQAAARAHPARHRRGVARRAEAARRDRPALVAGHPHRRRARLVLPPHRVLRPGARRHAREGPRRGDPPAERRRLRPDRRPALARPRRARAPGSTASRPATSTSTAASPARSCSASRSAAGSAPPSARARRRAARTTCSASASGCPSTAPRRAPCTCAGSRSASPSSSRRRSRRSTTSRSTCCAARRSPTRSPGPRSTAR